MRAQNLVLLGEMSAGRQALEDAELAPGTQAILMLCVIQRGGHLFLVNLFPKICDACWGLDLDEAIFTKNVRSERRGAASGPSGMTFLIT